MSMLEKPSSSSSSLSSSPRTLSVSSGSSVLARDIDPLLKDLNERKQSFRRNVVSLAAELKEVRSRLATQEQTYAKETLIRQEAETKAKNMEGEIGKLQKRLEERNEQLQASASYAEKYLKELDDLRTQLASNSSNCRCKLGEQLDHLQKDLQAREFSQKQLKDEVLRVEHDIKQAFALAKAGESKDSELRRLVDEVSPKNFEKMNNLLVVKDEEIAKLRDEIRIMSAHWKLKTKELESQLEKQRRADQELKKRVLKLEFCLQEARSQTRKLQRTGERRDKALKELRDQLAAKQVGVEGSEKQNFWETSGFKFAVSMSMLILVVLSKQVKPLRYPITRVYYL
ncbi:myosin heavy chain, cardiac muscle isoform-like [Quillaja saponaria]|uniref:Myosin heavy chain, cardiac muscle isoform-like n=1 Tax=Quillaja saponaria TaxID=32244 RepID=A0AAD7VJ85_QUISA|nr:myosin heavy chain, cardiac muscle isoform-like [Quillaja saponaria]